MQAPGIVGSKAIFDCISAPYSTQIFTSVFTQVRVFRAFPTHFPTDLFVGKPLAKELGRCLPKKIAGKAKTNTSTHVFFFRFELITLAH